MHCITDISGSKEGDRIRRLPNTGELGFSSHFVCDLLFNLGGIKTFLYF